MHSIRVTRLRLLAVALSTALLASPLAALADVPPIKIGGGVRASFTSVDADNAPEKVNDTNVESVRVYISGGIMDDVNFTLNTEYNPGDQKLVVMDAIARFEYSDQFNIWAGRFLPPSDRPNLYGPYYANNARPFMDGVQDGYPMQSIGRDDGFMYWGQFDRVKVSAGVFDTASLTAGKADVIYAARVMVDLLEVEKGYYLNGTYYGKDILAFGVATQSASNNNAYSVDGLFEKKIPGAGVVDVEAEYAKYDGLGGYGFTPSNQSDGFYILGSYLFPQKIGVGQFQVLGKGGKTTFQNPGLADVDLKTTELDVNYIIKAFSARVSLFYVKQNFDGVQGRDVKQVGLGVQLQL